MAIIKNIAGFGRIGETSDPSKGLLQNIVKFSDAAKDKAQAAGADPIVTAVKLGINLIPEGAFKKWLRKIHFSFLRNCSGPFLVSRGDPISTDWAKD